jgi:hypothetical protein
MQAREHGFERLSAVGFELRVEMPARYATQQVLSHRDDA